MIHFADIWKKKIPIKILIGIMGLMLACGCSLSKQIPDLDATGQPSGSKTDPAVQAYFDKGYKQYEKENYTRALLFFHQYIVKASKDSQDYDWAQFFFGVSLLRAGYSHAAVDILSDLINRKPNVKIVAFSLEIFEEITRTQPFDDQKIIENVICDNEFGFVDQKLADFINYYQGVYDWQHGFIDWGQAHFESISKNSYYYYKYLFHQSLYRIYKNDIDSAHKVLSTIITSPDAANDIKDKAKKTLARLYYESGAYLKADRLYQSIHKNILKQSGNLLERSWNHYRNGSLERAMGLLYAFSAPSFETHFTPEYFILKSFIYKDVCHYAEALAVVNEFKAKYGTALDNIYNRIDPLDNTPLLLVILNKPAIKKRYDFLNLIQFEKQHIADIEDKPLSGFLNRIYDLQFEQSKYRLRKMVKDEYEKMADALLQYEEQANLMEYEIGLDMYKRASDYHFMTQTQPGKEQKALRQVIYPFQGEYWNDEISNYKVTLENKCQEMQEWDIFFK